MRGSIVFFVLFLASASACGATGGGIVFDKPPALPDTGPTGPLRVSTPEVGVTQLISDAVSELGLDAKQRDELVAILDKIKAQHRQGLGARATLAIDMSRNVESAIIDERLLMLDAKNLGEQRAALGPSDAKGLEDLHRILRPEQRKKLADGLIAKADKLRTDDFASRYGVWRNDLKITPDQDAVIEPKLRADTTSADAAKAEREAWQARLRKTAAAITEPTFSASSFADPDPVGTTTARVQRVIAFLKIVVPELRQEQLENAAKFIRAEAGVQEKSGE